MKKVKYTKDTACEQEWFSVNDLADWIAQGTKDGKKGMGVWEWYFWFRGEIRSRYPKK